VDRVKFQRHRNGTPLSSRERRDSSHLSLPPSSFSTLQRVREKFFSFQTTDAENLTTADSEAFQDIVFGRKLVFSLDVYKIKSKRGNECDNVILRLWDDQNSDKPKDKSHSLFYFANTQSPQHHVEIHGKSSQPAVSQNTSTQLH
jgi:hypothetical protein